MTETPTPELKTVVNIDCGNAIAFIHDGRPLAGIKVERMGKEYVHHYVVALEPVPDGDMFLMYLDPDKEVVDSGARVQFTFEDGVDVQSDPAARPDVGHLFSNHAGTYLKIIEDPMSQKMFAFIDIETGLVMRRQERRLTTVYAKWQAAGNSVSWKSLSGSLDLLNL